ncbi:hypothetical protein MICA_1948 [Micavibrio aeruginosavorus ARL-13]|uniref:BioF2-like acetyltransferase domain-containing protein n=1 Tax=Micavibrio aeruginosavorus (strain ARL-13) TaxID=856793 RepID=G2KNL2_MICAA|nr:hypothetical protein MICA_1948 [Micavibrio aeruginosavorus ARL-13]
MQGTGTVFIVLSGFSYEKFDDLIHRSSAVRDDTYLNAPIYYVLTGRRGAWLHEGYGAAMVVCRDPHNPTGLLAFPEIGQEARGRLAASVLCGLDPPPGGVRLARFTDQDLAQLENALRARRDDRVARIERIDETVMDWRYPVHVLDTARVAEMKGTAFMKIRNKCRKVEDDISTLSLSDPRALKAMRAAQKYWEGSMVLRELDDMDLSTYYTMLFSVIQKWPHLFGGLVFLRGDFPVGFTVYDRPYMGTSNLLANLSDAMISGLADFQVVETCRAMAADHIAWMNFGGSETETLDKFKRKFMPVKSITIHSAEVHYEPRFDVNVRTTAILADQMAAY